MRYSRGFTLIELMVTIVVLAIAISIAAPSFSSIVRENRVLTATDDLMGALQLSRSEAVKRGQNVTLCRKNSAGNGCEAGGTWSNGWAIMAGTVLLKVGDGAEGITISGPNNGVVFQPSGMATAASDLFVVHSSCTGAQKRKLAVKLIGTTTSTKVNCQ